MNERDTLRSLVERYLDATQTTENEQKRERWRQLNSLKSSRPMIHIRGGRVWDEVTEVRTLTCETPELREAERWFRLMLYRATLGDDTVFQNWLPCRAVFSWHGWGIETEKNLPEEEKGAWIETHPLTDISDLSQLRVPRHVIDEQGTAEKHARLVEAIGDLIEVDLDRSPAYKVWTGDLATDLGHLRGIQELMMDMYDAPDELHALLAFMRDGILKVHQEAEEAGDWGLSAHENQSMVYCDEFTDPAPNQRGKARSELWGYMAAQELTLVSPAMHDEFMLQYQLPILEKFGMTAYGCCEDLTQKIGILRQIPNLRRIAVAPLADVEQCAAAIGTDYVISYRPNPADMVCLGIDEKRIRRIVGNALDVFKGLHVEINLKDVDTCQHEPERLSQWVKIVRSVIEEKA